MIRTGALAVIGLGVGVLIYEMAHQADPMTAPDPAPDTGPVWIPAPDPVPYIAQYTDQGEPVFADAPPVVQPEPAVSIPEPVAAITEPFTNFLDSAFSTVQNIVTTVDPSDINTQAFLTLIRTGEGTLGERGYRTLFGGGTFDSFADHPRTVIRRNGINSSAAGAYQFLTKTWDEMAAKYDLPDFSPANQEIAAIGLIKRRGALADVQAGRFKSAIEKCNKEWASLPGSPYGQPTITYSKAALILASNGAISTEAIA